MAARVGMTSMPELVAILHSFVGLAAVLVGLSMYSSPSIEVADGGHFVLNIEIYLDVFIGAITFPGSGTLGCCDVSRARSRVTKVCFRSLGSVCANRPI